MHPTTPVSLLSPKAKAEDARPAGEPSRVERLVELVDHCTAAKGLSDALGDRFLSYMLAMTIQAARGEMRPAVLEARG